MAEAEERRARGFAGAAGWSALDFWSQQAGGLAVLLVVGKIAGPGAVGLMATAQILAALAMALLLDGVSDALVQREAVEPRHRDTAFWLLLGAGLLAGGVLAALAPPAAWIFGQPELLVLLPLLALGLPLVGISASLQGLQQRAMGFRLLALRTLVAQAAGLTAAVAVAFQGYGAEALVAHFLVSRLVDAGILLLFGATRPGLRFSGAAAAEMLRYGRHRVGNQLVGFLVMQVDRLAVALVLAPVAVGLYAVAERIALAFVNGLSGVATRAAFPLLSRCQSDEAAFGQSLRDLLLAVNLVAVPCFIGLALVGQDLVLLLLGPGWAEAAWPLALLALGGIPHASNYLVATAANARGRPDAVLGASLRIAVLRLGASLAAAPLGLVAVAMANLLVTVLSTWLLLRALPDVVPGAWSAIRQGAAPALAAGAAMAACVLGLGLALGGATPALRLGAEVLAGMAAYPAALWLVAPPALRGRLRTALLRRSAGRPAVSRS